jgi:hypothetical protein
MLPATPDRQPNEPAAPLAPHKPVQPVPTASAGQQHDIIESWERVTIKLTNAPNRFVGVFWSTEIAYNRHIIISLAKVPSASEETPQRWNGQVNFLERSGGVSSFLRKAMIQTGGHGSADFYRTEAGAATVYLFDWA